MLLCNRRYMILGAAALAGCGFTPLYAPENSPAQWALPDVTTPQAHLFHNALISEGIDDNPNGTALQYRINTTEDSIGQIADGSEARRNIQGEVVIWRSDDPQDKITLRAFTGYDASGAAVAVRAAKLDAEARLITLLARQTALQLTLWQRARR